MMNAIPPSLPVPFLSLPLSSSLFFSIPHYPPPNSFPLFFVSHSFPFSLLVFSRSLAEDVVTISVKDCGAGLSAEDLGRLFQEGVQINPNKLQVLHIGKTAKVIISRANHTYTNHTYTIISYKLYLYKQHQNNCRMAVGAGLVCSSRKASSNFTMPPFGQKAKAKAKVMTSTYLVIAIAYNPSTNPSSIPRSHILPYSTDPPSPPTHPLSLSTAGNTYPLSRHYLLYRIASVSS